VHLSRFALRAAAALIATVSSVALVPLAFTTAHAATADAATAEDVFVSRVNALRQSEGLAPLRVDPTLVKVARDWAASLSQQNCVCHHPEFLTGNPDDAARIVTTNWIKIGENVGTGSAADQIEDAFEKSPKHRNNLLDPEFDSIGVGVVVVNDAMWVSQQFQDLPGRSPSGVKNTSLASKDAPDELALAAPKPKSKRSAAEKSPVLKLKKSAKASGPAKSTGPGTGKPVAGQTFSAP
jgi:uncharacterized protein YkwD